MSELAPRLSTSDAERVEAIAALAAEGAVAVPRLVHALRERSWAVRRAVVSALAALGDVAVATMAETLRTSRDDEAQIAALVDALSASTATAESLDPELAGLARDPDVAVVCDAAQILGRRRSSSSVALLVGLTSHVDDNVSVSAVEALGRVGGGAGVEALIALASGDNFFRTFPAIDALGRSSDPRAVTALAALLGTALYTSEAARALGKTGDLRAVPPLAGLLGGAHGAGVRVAAVALAELHDRRADRIGADDDVAALVRSAAPRHASTLVVRAAEDADGEERVAIARVLGWVGRGEEAVAFLLNLLDAEPRQAEAAIASLQAVGGQVAVMLSEALRRADGPRRAVLLPLLSAWGAASVDVTPYLDDPDPRVRAAACEVLARNGSAHAVPRLFALLADPDGSVALVASGAIQALGSAETERLVMAALRDPSLTMRRAAFRLLGYFGYAAGFDEALVGTEDPDPQVRDSAMAALAFIDDPRAIESLLRACRGPALKLRAAAARALGQVKPSSEVLSSLRSALADEDPWVRYYAVQALGKLRDDEASELLVPLLADAAGQVRVAAVEALARSGHEAAIIGLERSLQSADPDVQRAALVGLGQSGRRESIPLLVAATKSDDSATRVMALSSLAKFEGADIVEALRAAALDVDESVRSAAVELLGSRAGSAATEALTTLLSEAPLRPRVTKALAVDVEGRVEGIVLALDHADEAGAANLATALARLRLSHARAGLVQVLAGATSVASRCAAAEAIALLGVPALRDALAVSAKTDPDARVRRLCARLLEP